MKTIIKNVLVECSVAEFKELMAIQVKNPDTIKKSFKRKSFSVEDIKLIKDTYSNPKNVTSGGKLKRGLRGKLARKLNKSEIAIASFVRTRKITNYHKHK